jgi:hypothetical protein
MRTSVRKNGRDRCQWLDPVIILLHTSADEQQVWLIAEINCFRRKPGSG